LVDNYVIEQLIIIIYNFYSRLPNIIINIK